jgi:ribonuclease D
LYFQGPPERKEPWRRTSGVHKARGRRALGLVRELWQTRDRIAAERDITPGRILPDASLLELATTPPTDLNALKAMRIMRNRGPRRFAAEWFAAIERGQAISEIKLPTTTQRIDGPPPPRAWADKSPEAAERLGRSREVIQAVADEFNLPTENLISPQLIRNLAWAPPADVTHEAVTSLLAEQGARNWQIGLISEALTEALSAS